MDQDLISLIDDTKHKALRNEYVGKDVILKLMSINPASEEAEYLGKAGREIASFVTKDKGRIGSAFGMDLAPCPMNCEFCALGEKWHLFDDKYEYTAKDVIAVIRELLPKGFYMFTIRTTEYYPVEKLEEMVNEIRYAVPGEYYINLNVGELSRDDCQRLYAAGCNSAYHTCRLGEGKDTPFEPETRLNTMKAISESDLALSSGLDPIGIEHTDEELADMLEKLRELNAGTVCVMKRISVPGTPKGSTPMVDERRIAQLAAITRIAGAGKWKNVACSPPNLLALRYGANAFGTTTGANPRYPKQDLTRWSVPHEKAIAMLREAGYALSNPKDVINEALWRRK